MRYVAFIHKDEDSCYGVSFPDLPGCISAGDTMDDAVNNAAEALGFHLEGMQEDGIEYPAPRSVDQLNADNAEDMDTATVAYVSAIIDLGSTKPVNISLDKGLIQAIDAEAKRRKVTRSAFITTATRHEISGCNVLTRSIADGGPELKYGTVHNNK